MGQLDWATLVMLVTAILSGAGLIPSLIQSLSLSRTDKTRVETEKERLEREAGVQLANTTATMQNASALLIGDLQEESIVLRKRTAELSAMVFDLTKKVAVLEGSGLRMVSSLEELAEAHLSKADGVTCPWKDAIQKRMQEIIDKYSPVFANGNGYTKRNSYPAAAGQEGDIGNG